LSIISSVRTTMVAVVAAAEAAVVQKFPCLGFGSHPLSEFVLAADSLHPVRDFLPRYR